MTPTEERQFKLLSSEERNQRIYDQIAASAFTYKDLLMASSNRWDVEQSEALAKIIAGFPPEENPNNAIVPLDAMIQPPQAYVDAFADIWNDLAAGRFIVPRASSFDAAAIPGLFNALSSVFHSEAFLFSFNTGTEAGDGSLSTANVDAILAAAASAAYACTIDLSSSGQSMGVPTPTSEGPFVSNADITTIVGLGGTVTVMEYVNRAGSGDKEAVTYAP